MKSKLVSMTLIGVLAMSACGSETLADVNVSELETECDCAAAMIIGMKEEKELKANDAKEDSEEVEKWESKMKEISKHCRDTKEFKMKDIRECPVMVEAKKSMGK